MKIMAETPEEDKLLKEIENVLTDKGYSNIFTGTFTDSFLREAIAEKLSDIHYDCVKTWTPSQRLWFYNICEEFSNSIIFKNFENEYSNIIGIYADIFKNEQIAFKKASKDFGLFLEIKRNTDILHVDNYKKLAAYLNKAVVKGEDRDIKSVSCYYDKNFSQYVMVLNSIKVPFTYKKRKIKEEFVIYGWNDLDCNYSFEFLKPELMSEISKENNKESDLKKALHSQNQMFSVNKLSLDEKIISAKTVRNDQKTQDYTKDLNRKNYLGI